jgi:hypothetical protein
VRWTFDLESLLSASRLGQAIDEWPVVWTDVEGSKVKFTSTTR